MPQPADVHVEEYAASGGSRPALHYYGQMDDLCTRARPGFWTGDAQGYWVMTDHDVILEGLQDPELFSSRAVSADNPEPQFTMIPIMLDPPEHTKWRRLLGGYFSPKRVQSFEGPMRALARSLVEQLKIRGECDFYAEFAGVFPTTIFLTILGLPVEELDKFMAWEHEILHTTPETDPGETRRLTAVMEVMGYFGALVEQRRTDPVPDAPDIVSHAADWTLDGEPVAPQDVVNCLFLLFIAGLDTVAAELGYAMHHLATHDADRRRIAAEPDVVPRAVEELLRTYPTVQAARIATRDIDFHGCPVRAGQMVAFPMSAAGRDQQTYANATTVDFDREDKTHLTFGAGPHRCLGSHLARRELVIALEEWHRAIPDYRLGRTEDIREHTGGVWSLESLPLAW
jgi:cytochrome P450